MQTSINDIEDKVLGRCGLFEERQVGGERFNFFTQCKSAKTATIILRGGAQQFLEESHRSLWDALNIVKRAFESTSVVAGGGATEMEILKELWQYSKTIDGKRQLVVGAFAKAFEIVPRQLAENAGFDPNAANVM